MSVPGKDQEISTSQPLHSVSVAGIVVDDQSRALLIRRRDNSHWEPPGGVLELRESIHDGLRREMREETGLLVEPLQLTGVYKNMNRAIIALVFKCQPLDGALTPNSEVTEFRWAASHEITAMVSEAFAVRILDALRFDGTPAVRAHDGAHLV